MQSSLKKYYLLFITAAAMAVFVIAFLPFIWGGYLSFTDAKSIDNFRFVGLDNYVKIFSTDFLSSLYITLKMSFLSVISVNIIAFILAIFLTKGLKTPTLFRLSIFIPAFISAIAAGYIVKLFFMGLFSMFDIKTQYDFFKLFITTNWQIIGIIMVVYMFTIIRFRSYKNIMDAAAIDGFSSVQTFFKIKLPAFINPIISCLVLTFICSFRLIDYNLVFSSAKPEMLALNIYNSFSSKSDLAAAQAKSVVFFIIMLLLTIVLVIAVKKADERISLNEKQ